MVSFKELGNMGRLGNQLFQIATTINFALTHNEEYLFPPWEYSNDFNLYDCFSDNISVVETFQEKHFHYSPITYKPNINLQGFFQSEEYFKESQGIIQQLLTPKIGHGIKYDHAAIHVRRGDYLSLSKEYVQLDMDYYQKAMQLVGSTNYIVFSDDIAWCKQNFHGDNITFSENKTAVEDLALMLSCEHIIIANSSFSWWGAYLNKNPSKIVVAPEKWFGSGLPHNTKDLLPKTWIQI